MKNKKAITLTLIGLFIFLFGIIGLTYAYWQITRTQSDENLVYTDCLKLDVTWGEKGFSLTDAYPMTNNELVSDFFPTQTPYHFTITNECDNEVPISINMESLTSSDLKDEYVDVILWEDNNTDIFNPDEDTVLSSVGNRIEFDSEESVPNYNLTNHKINDDKIIEDAKEAYQLYKFKIGANETKQFNLLLFMDYETPVSTSQDVTNNVSWNGKITLNNYEMPKVNMGGINVQTVEEGDGLYLVDHTVANITDENGEKVEGWDQTEYRYAGANPNNYVTFNSEKWRIIGLVNVLIPQEDGSEKVEQRVKVIRSESIGQYSWDNKSEGTGSATTPNGSGDWTDSTLMGLLNGIYYNSTSDNCYKNMGSGIANLTTCNFDGNGDDVRGIKDVQNLIEKNLLWNIGGSDSVEVNTYDMYNYERGTDVYTDDGLPWPRSTKWTKNNTRTPGTEEFNPDLFNGVGLMYISDYGYGTSGGTLGREACYKIELNKWRSGDYQTQCFQTDWLKPKSNSNYVITPYNDVTKAYTISSNGYISFTGYSGLTQAHEVYPTLYLKKDVQIANDNNDGSYEKPYTLVCSTCQE